MTLTIFSNSELERDVLARATNSNPRLKVWMWGNPDFKEVVSDSIITPNPKKEGKK